MLSFLNLKKTFLILLGLSIVVVIFFLGKNGAVEASKKNGEKFDDWVVSCINNAELEPKNKKDKSNKKKKTSSKEEKQVCFLVQQVEMAQDDGKKNVIAVYQFGYIGKKNSLVLIQTVPLMVNLEAGVNLTADKKTVIQSKYQFCGANGCQAVSDSIDSSNLDPILTAKEVTVNVIDVTGKSASLPISIKGLKQGLEYLK